jgi:hypothetical protein
MAADHLKTGQISPVFEWLKHSKTGTENILFSNVSGIRGPFFRSPRMQIGLTFL